MTMAYFRCAGIPTEFNRCYDRRAIEDKAMGLTTLGNLPGRLVTTIAESHRTCTCDVVTWHHGTCAFRVRPFAPPSQRRLIPTGIG